MVVPLQIRLVLPEKHRKAKSGQMLEKKCRRAHPSNKSMGIPSNPASKKLLSMGVLCFNKRVVVLKGK